MYSSQLHCMIRVAVDLQICGWSHIAFSYKKGKVALFLAIFSSMTMYKTTSGRDVPIGSRKYKCELSNVKQQSLYIVSASFKASYHFITSAGARNAMMRRPRSGPEGSLHNIV